MTCKHKDKCIHYHPVADFKSADNLEWDEFVKRFSEGRRLSARSFQRVISLCKSAGIKDYYLKDMLAHVSYDVLRADILKVVEWE